MTRTLKTTLATSVAFLALAATGWAYLSATGVGAGDGSTAAARTVVIAAGEAAGNTLLPLGESHGRLTVSLTNSHGSPLRVGELALDTARPGGAYSQAARDCGVTFTASTAVRTNGGSGWTVQPGTTLNVTLENATSMPTTAPSSCQGQDFAIHLKAA
jgi:hypothetical protein